MNFISSSDHLHFCMQQNQTQTQQHVCNSTAQRTNPNFTKSVRTDTMILRRQNATTFTNLIVICINICIFVASVAQAHPLVFPEVSSASSADSATRQGRQAFSDSVTCVPIRDCKTIIKSLNGPITPEKVRRLQNLTCGFEGGDPKVKCPIQADIATRTGPISRKVLHADITVHSNFHLLPRFEDCGVTSVKINNYILGGITATLGSYPWIARLGYELKKELPGYFEFHCAGTLISNKYVLTAAHCVTGGTGTPARSIPKIVRLGEHDSTVDPEFSPEMNSSSYVKDVRIEKIIAHSDYDQRTRVSDIALIRLAEEVSFDTPWIKPICLPFLQENFPSLAKELGNSSEKWYGEIAGWGKTEVSTEGERVLQHAHVPLLSNSVCNEIYHGKTIIANSQICAGGEAGVDSCAGDSGGPLMVFEDDSKRYFQGGVVSFGPSICGLKGYPGIYTRVSSYFTWLLDSMEK